MRGLDVLENLRLEHQVHLDSRRSARERNVLGQFATPPGLALEIAQYVTGLWNARGDRIRFLDPAIGTGSFFAALKRAADDKIAWANGIEIDPEFARAARRLWGNAGLRIRSGDFTKLPFPIRDRPNLILTNPPYVRHHHLEPAEKVRLQKLVARRLGYKASGLSGLYAYFMLLAHDWLADGGLGVWLVPSEFMDVNYGETVRRYLTEKVTLLHIHRFEAADVQFEDALVSSAVIVFQKKPSQPETAVRFSYNGSLLKPKTQLVVQVRELKGGYRWTNWSRGLTPAAKGQHTTSLADLLEIKRGIATGANDFFIISRHQAKELALPERFLKPILPSPRRLNEPVIEGDNLGFPLVDEQLVLLDCDLPEAVVRRSYPALWAYLQSGEGIRQRYLVRLRDPWYSQEHREPAPFLCTYMGRSGKRSPFRFFWNRSRAITPNVFLMLYPRGVLKAALVSNPALEETIFRFLQSITPEDLIHNGRVYGGGLHKLEPAELGAIAADRLVHQLHLPQTTHSPQLDLLAPSRH